jgi:hypothetical protein
MQLQELDSTSNISEEEKNLHAFISSLTCNSIAAAN